MGKNKKMAILLLLAATVAALLLSMVNFVTTDINRNFSLFLPKT